MKYKRRVLLLMFFSIGVLAESSENHFSTMMKAIKNHDSNVVSLLIAEPIDLNMREDSRASPTFATYAAFLGKTDILQALLESGANIESLNGDAYTPLMMAILGNRKESVILLLSKGANVSAVGARGETIYSLAERYPEILKLLPKN